MKIWWIPILIYMCVILIFGAIYSCHTEHFYFNTFIYEDSYNILKQNVRTSLINGVKYSFEKNNNTNIIMYNDFVFNTSHIYIYNLRVENRTIFFKLSLDVKKIANTIDLPLFYHIHLNQNIPLITTLIY